METLQKKFIQIPQIVTSNKWEYKFIDGGHYIKSNEVIACLTIHPQDGFGFPSHIRMGREIRGRMCGGADYYYQNSEESFEKWLQALIW